MRMFIDVFKSMFFRLLGCVLILSLAWFSLSFLKQQEVKRWFSFLEENSVEASSEVSSWFNDKIINSSKFVEDGKLLPFFDNNKNLEITSSIKEDMHAFTYEHNVSGVYVVDTRNSSKRRVLAKTSGALELPFEVMDKLVVAASGNYDYLTDLVKFKRRSYLLVSSAIQNDVGKTLGYLVYIQPIATALKSLIHPNPVSRVKVIFSIHREYKKGMISTLVNYVSFNPKVLLNKNLDVQVKFFEENPEASTSSGIMDWRGNEIISGVSKVPLYKNWSVSSYVDSELALQSTWLQNVIKVVAVVMAILLMITPSDAGAYSSWLRGAYFTLGFPVKHAQVQKGYIGSTGNKNKQKIVPPTKQEMKDIRSRSVGKGIGGNAGSGNRNSRKGGGRNSSVNSGANSYNIEELLKQDKTKLLYQPIKDIINDTILYYEVFLRFLDDSGNEIAPSVWLPEARSKKLFGVIDDKVIDKCVNKYFIGASKIKGGLGFNVSAKSIKGLKILNQLLSLSDSNDVVSSKSIIELQAHELIEDKEALNFIRKCRRKGFRFCIDYFGGGVGAIKAAKTLKFSFMKIDMQDFDLNLRESQKEFILLVKAAEKMQLDIIVEKVESDRELSFCKKIGVRYVQGFFIAKLQNII